MIVDPKKCTGCGLCIADCPTRIIKMENGIPGIKPENDDECIVCQHCLAICPTAAVTVGGKLPANSRALEAVDATALEMAILARRSVRQFSGEVDEQTLRRVMDIVNHAPTAVNARDLHFTIVSGMEAMAELRKRTCEALIKDAARIDASRQWIVSVARLWLNRGVDGIFRNAPHIVVVSCGKEQVHPKVDSVIALSYFDLYASSLGIGTTWCGMFDTVLRQLPESRSWLGIPDDHEIGYAMLFGKTGVRYARAAQHSPAGVKILKGLQN
ncbi:MAG: nitroreductase family protein [Deltaproteobacteria bacterium]|jgi:NAD-dependent dihydropyrimidine dehydrogenase PreA subunit/nitroreductase|nr:nitroreductase family protein [Deltaproteobacteria bacterium]